MDDGSSLAPIRAAPAATRDPAAGPADVGLTDVVLTARELRLGVLSIIGAGLLFTTSHALIKLEGAYYPLVQLMFFRGFFALIPLAPFLFRDGVAMLKTRRPGLHAARSLSGIVSMLCFFYALTLLPLADVTAINFTMPLFVTALAVPLLGEKVGWRRWSAVLVGFSGILLMVRPGASVLDAAILIALASAFLYAVAVICMRRLGATERSATTTFYFTLACALVGAALLPFYWVPPTPAGWVVLILVGLIGGTAQLLMTAGYRFAPAGIVAPFDYVSMVWAVLLGFLIWGDVPTAGIVGGAALVIGSGLYILYREQRVLRRPGGAPEARPKSP